MRTTPPSVVQNYAAVPASIRQLHLHITISVDIMCVHSLPFLVKVSQRLKFTTPMFIKSWKRPQLITGITKVIQSYAKYVFLVNFINSDNKFEAIRDDFPEVVLNINAEEEHVPEAEQKNRVIKERTRVVRHTLPFRKITENMVIRMVIFSVFWLNSFPVSASVSGNLRPTTIITGRMIYFSVHCNLEFGAYTQVHEYDRPRNSEEACTLEAVCLGPSDNIQ